MKKLSLLFFSLSLVLAFTFTPKVFAEPVKRTKDGQLKRQQLREKIRTVRTIRLVESLNLEEQKALQVSKTMNQYDDKQMELRKNRKEQIENLRKHLKEENPDEAALQKSVADLLKIDDDFNRLRRAEFQDLSKLLSPVQEAKFILFRQEFNRAVRDAIRHGRHQKVEDKPEEKPLAPHP